jgi:hypothetical protein
MQKFHSNTHIVLVTTTDNYLFISASTILQQQEEFIGFGVLIGHKMKIRQQELSFRWWRQR